MKMVEESNSNSKIIIYLHMPPSDYDDEKVADIILFYDKKKTDLTQIDLNSLERGQEIGFNGTFISLPDKSKGTQMQAIALWKESGILELKPMINQKGRYRSDNFLGK